MPLTNHSLTMNSQENPKPIGLLFDSLEQEAYLQLWRSYDRLREIEDSMFARHSITAQQYNALRLLRAAHPEKLTTADLTARLVSRAPDMTRLLDKLEELSCITRNRCATNRRTVEVAITNEGIDKLNAMASDVRECNREQLGHLNQRQLETLIELLREARRPHEALPFTNSTWPGNL